MSEIKSSIGRGAKLQYLDGILKIANLILALIAGVIGASLIKVSLRRKKLNAWVLLIVALVFFAIQMVLGALRAFKIFESPYLTHIVPTFIMAFLIIALIMQINIQKLK